MTHVKPVSTYIPLPRIFLNTTLPVYDDFVRQWLASFSASTFSLPSYVTPNVVKRVFIRPRWGVKKRKRFVGPPKNLLAGYVSKHMWRPEM